MEKKSESTEWNLFPLFLFVFGVCVGLFFFFYFIARVSCRSGLEVRGDFGREVCWPYLLGDWPD